MTRRVTWHSLASSMLPLSSISVSGYRSFAETTKLELAPLTLLYGWNNAGKSSLLRVLPLLADSVQESASLPLEAERVFDSKVTIGDLCFRGSLPPRARFELAFPQSAALRRAVVTISIDKGVQNRPIISELLLYQDREQPVWSAERIFQDSNAPREAAQRYRVRAGSTRPRNLAIEFRGLLPVLEKATRKTAIQPLVDFAAALSTLRSSVVWLRSQRSQSERYFPDTGRLPSVLAADGSDVPFALRADPELCRSVSRFFEIHFQRQLTCMESSNRQFQVVFRRLDQSEQAIDLVDMGQGVQNVLPILVALERARRGQSPIVAIEEADSNLHDNAQAWLGEHLCGLAAAQLDQDSAVLIETHSQTLMMSVQLAVASGVLPKDRVRLYWVAEQAGGTSRAEPVALSASGEPEGRWPSGAFADRFALARKLMATRKP